MKRNVLYPLLAVAMGCMAFFSCKPIDRWNQYDPGATPGKVTLPFFEPPAGSYPEAQQVLIRCNTEQASIYYAIDGSIPSRSSTSYVTGTRVTVAATGTVKAIAVKSGMTDSDVASAAYTITGAAVPFLSLSQGVTYIVAGGSFDFGSTVTGTPKDAVFTVSNLGSAALSLTGGVEMTGTDAGLFSVTVAPASTVAAGTATAFTVRFAPTTAGAKTAGMTIASNDGAHSPYAVTITGTATAAPAPQIALRQGSRTIAAGTIFDMGSSPVNTGKETTFTIANTGTSDLSLTGTPLVALGGTDAARFTVISTPGGTVSSGGTTTFTVRFTPTVGGAKTATVSIASSDSAHNPFLFTLNGTGLAPQIAVAVGATQVASGGAYDFGSTLLNGNNDVVFTVANVGNADLTLDGTPKIAVSGADQGMFTVTAQPSSPVIAGGDTTFTIRFTPTGTGSKASTVSITSNDGPRNPYAFTIQGTGSSTPAPQVTIKQAATGIPFGGSHGFGLVPVGTNSDLVFTILNSGTAELSLTGTPAVSGNDLGMFSVVSTPAGTVAAGGSTMFTLRFTPSSAGAKMATVSIGSNDGAHNPFTFSIDGTGAAPQFTMKQETAPIASGGSFDAGSTIVGTNLDVVFAIYNTGNADLVLSGTPKVAVGGLDSTAFNVTIQPTTPATAGSNASFSVRFAPTAVGQKSAILTILSNDAANSPFAFTIQGTGVILVAAPSVSAASPTNDTTPTWTWTSGGGGNGTYRYRLDNADLTVSAIQTSTASFTPGSALTEGSHTLNVQERDIVGNWSQSGSATVSIDLTPPGTPSVSVPSFDRYGWPNWTWTSGGGGNGTFRYRLADPDLSTGATETTTLSYLPGAALAEGSYTLYVQERDGVGNWSTSGSATVLEDKTPPAAPVVTATTPTADTTPTWTWSGGGGGNGTFRYKLDDSNLFEGATETTLLSYTPDSALPLGSHSLYVMERDEAGNWAASYVTVLITLPTYYVSTAGNDSNAGTNPQYPKRNIQSTIDAANAAVTVGEVHVAAGTYTELLTIKPGISLKGGYSPDFSVRDWDAYVSKVSVTSIESVVQAITASDPTITSATVIEGMYVDIQLSTQGQTELVASGIDVSGGASPDILHNTVVINDSLIESPSSDRDYIICIRVPNGGYATHRMNILDNKLIAIRTNSNTPGFPTAIGIWFRCLNADSNVVVARNRISVSGDGIPTAIQVEAVLGGLVIRDNYISAQNTTGGSVQGIRPGGGLGTIFSNNTILLSGGATNTYGMYFYNTSGPFYIYNNIFASTTAVSSAMWSNYTMDPGTVYDYNLLFNLPASPFPSGATNGGHNFIYPSTNPFTASMFTSTSLDSNIADGDSTDIHLNDPSNYAVNKGMDASSMAYGSVTEDIDSESRPKGAVHDIGADEK